MDSAGEASVKTAEKLPKDKLMDLLYSLEASLAICGVCNDPPEDGVVTICRHVFCYECVSLVLTSDFNICPEPGCRRQLSNAVVFSEATLLSCISDEPNCQTHDSTSLIVPTSTDAIPSLKGPTTAQQRVDEFVFVDNFKIPKDYEMLYKKIHGKYGHIATKKVIKSSDTVLVACVCDLLRIISAMETKRGVELSEDLLKEWEGIIKDAEALKFNVKWFREGFERLKIQQMSDVDEQVLGAMQVEYVGLCTRKDELETDLSELKIQIRKAEAKISSKREAIREKQTQKFIFQNEPVLSIVLNT